MRYQAALCLPVVVLLFLSSFRILAANDVSGAGAFGDLEIEIIGIQSSQRGVINVNIYRGEEGWLKPDRAALTDVFPVQDKNVMSVVFTNLPYHDAYAVQIFHDRNQNEQLDFRWFPFPKPKEGVGVSNNHTRMGPPIFENARFHLNQPSVKLTIQMRY